MATIADRLHQFVEDEKIFPGNPDAVTPALIGALAVELARAIVEHGTISGKQIDGILCDAFPPGTPVSDPKFQLLFAMAYLAIEAAVNTLDPP